MTYQKYKSCCFCFTKGEAVFNQTDVEIKLDNKFNDLKKSFPKYFLFIEIIECDVSIKSFMLGSKEKCLFC